MNKTDIIKETAYNLGITKKAAGQVVDEVFYVITQAMNRGDKVKINGFATLFTREYPATEIKSPFNGAQITLKPRRLPKARFSKRFKDALSV